MSFESAHNYSDYQRYLDIKRRLHINYHKINMVDACAIDLIDALVVHSKSDCYHVCCALLQRICIAPLREAFEKHKNVFTYGVLRRSDHEALSHAMAESVDDSQWVRIEYTYRPYKSISRFLRFWFAVRSLPVSLVSRAYIAAKMAGYSCVIDDLETNFRDFSLAGKHYIPFCAPINHEALMTLYFKTKGAKTYCTFHGNFGRYVGQIANDVVNGENIHTDRVLVFGETQKNDLIRDFAIDPQKISVAGNPKYPYRPISLKGSYTSCLILGGIGLYDEDLRELLLVVEAVAKQTDITFALKPHPLSHIQNDDVWKEISHVRLLDKAQTIQTLFQSDEYDFAITHNTSSYYECFIAGLKVFRWAKNENLDFEGLDDRFVNGEQLLEKIKKASETSNEILSQEAETLLKNVLGYGLNKYNQYINE